MIIESTKLNQGVNVILQSDFSDKVKGQTNGWNVDRWTKELTEVNKYLLWCHKEVSKGSQIWSYVIVECKSTYRNLYDLLQMYTWKCTY